MSELGESSSVAAEKPETPTKGNLKVIVQDGCTGEGVKDVKVTVEGNEVATNDDGEASFNSLDEGAHSISAKIHFTDCDYATFIVHYPKILNKHEAKSAAKDVDFVEANKETESVIELSVYKLVGDIVFHRRHIDLNGSDKYGHWWTVVNAGTSYGWWPKYPLGSPDNQASTPPTSPAPLPADPSAAQQVQHKFDSAVYSVKQKAWEMRESSLGQTLSGVEGELNGQTSFGGTATMDPHHIMGDEGDEQYQSVRWDCFDPAAVESDIDRFATSYSGGWSWRVEAGNHCHTFQKKLMKQLKLDSVKVLK